MSRVVWMFVAVTLLPIAAACCLPFPRSKPSPRPQRQQPPAAEEADAAVPSPPADDSSAVVEPPPAPEPAVDLSNDEIEDQADRGYHAWQAEDWKTAAAHFEKVLAAQPEHRDGLWFLADVHHTWGLDAYDEDRQADSLAEFRAADALLLRLERAFDDLDEDERDLIGRNAYDLACLSALSGDRKTALDSLEKAVQFGFDDVEHIESDADLESIRPDLRYREILAKARRSAAGT